jgi:general stress protein 26
MVQEVGAFAEIAAEVEARARRIVWCVFTTVDGQGRPRSRMLHPVWEGPVAWIATGRASFKARQIDANPWVSVSYWDPQHQQIFAECHAAWEDDPDEKRRVWDYIKGQPEPYGYDLGMFWSSAEDPGYGLLRLRPWRLELSALADMMTRTPPKVWRQDVHQA